MVSENPREFTERESLYILKNSLSEKALQAWQASLGERRGLGGGLTCSVDGDRAGGVFIFSVYWTPGSLDDEPPEVLEGGFSVSGASFHQAIPDSARIPVSGFSVILHRDVRSGISIELETSQGAISAAVPAIELSPAVSSSYSLAVIRTGNKYEARISSKRADQENISSAVYKIGLRKRITGSNLPVVLVPLTRVMTDRDPESQFSVVFKHERVPWIVADVNTRDGRTFTYKWEG